MGRIQKKIPVRDAFCIITNGKKTEKNYFDLVKRKRSIYKVEIKFLDADPLRLVEYAVKIDNANQILCVFDIDNTYNEGRLIPAINLAYRSTKII